MKYDPIILQKCKNNKQRKLANIRTRNALNKLYQEMVNNGELVSYKIKGVKIVNRVQSAGICIVPNTPVKDITVNIGFVNESIE
jgi:Skp family chaperone for outer membrane proteins